MAEIFAWSTAELEFELRDKQGAIPEGILDGVEEAVVTIAQGGKAIVEKRASDGSVGVDVPSAVLRIRLSQQETSKLKGGTKASPKSADAQVNIYYSDERRNATYESSIAVYRNRDRRHAQMRTLLDGGERHSGAEQRVDEPQRDLCERELGWIEE